MPGVVQVQNSKPSGMQTAMTGLQAYGTINGIQNSNAQTDAIKRRIAKQQGPQPQAPQSGDATGQDQDNGTGG